MVAPCAHRARRRVDGRLSGELPEADPQRRRSVDDEARDRGSGGRFASGARQGRGAHGHGSDALIPRFTAPLLPELILSIGGTVLMIVAAFTGRRGSGVT